MANAVDNVEVSDIDDFEMSEAERKTIKGELNELLNPKNGDDKEERRQTLSAQEVVEQPDVAQLIESVAKLNWTETSGKCFVGTGFLANITLGVEDRLGFFTAGHNLYDKGTKQLVKASDIKLRFKDIRKHTIKVAFSKFLRQNYLLIVAYKTTKIISRNGQESTQPCRKGLDFGAVIFTDPVDRAARFLSRLGLSYLQVASRGACSSAPTKPVQLIGFPQYEENYSPMRILPGNELVVPPGNIPDHSYDLETEPGASGGSVLDKGGRVIAVHIRGQNIKKGDQGNWGLGFDIIREELQLCHNIPSLLSQAQPGTSDPHKPQGMPSVVKFMKNLKLDEYISAFEEHHIDMEVLEDCEPEELEQMLEKMEVSFGHSKKIKKALKHEKQEKKKQMKEQEREEDQLENIGVNETAAASNVKMSCGVIIKIIGIIVIAVIAIIAHHYLGYKGGESVQWSGIQTKIWGNDECKHLGNFDDLNFGLEDCKKKCLEIATCTAINYNKVSKACVLRGCTQPVQPPQWQHGAYRGYYITDQKGVKLKFQLKGVTGQEKVTISIDGNEEEFVLTTEWQTFSYPRPSIGSFSVKFLNDKGPMDVFIRGHESQVADLLPDFASNKDWGCGTDNENERCSLLRNGLLAWNGKYTYTLKDCPEGYDQKTGDTPGWGSLKGKIVVPDRKACSDLCNQEIGCLSFEHSNTEKICNLNTEKNPVNAQNYKDYQYCSKSQGAVIVSADQGEAAEYWGYRMGLYRQLDGSSYQQVGGRCYLYQVLPERHWFISDTLMKKTGFMKNPTESSSVPASGWKFYDGSEWRDDPELSVRMVGQELQCNTITITSSRCTQKEVLGDYKRIKNDVLNGRPVFRNSFNHYLRVSTGDTAWTVGSQRDDGTGWLQSGRATSCPAHPYTGLTRRNNRKHWALWDGKNWVEDPTFVVTCKIY